MLVNVLHSRGFFPALTGFSVIISISFSIMSPAEANFFDFLGRLMGDSQTESKTSSTNSQLLPLLNAPLNQNLLARTGGSDIATVQNSALLSRTGPLGSIADVEEQQSESISVYVVREGDSLSSIAELYGVSVNTVLWANDLNKGSYIQPGQVLVILPVSGIQYTVKKGDTLKSIAKKFKGDQTEILAFNSFSSEEDLVAGVSIIIPSGEVETEEPQKKSSSPSSSGSAPKKSSGPNYAGYYIRPLIGGVKTQGIHGTNGVDLASSCGTPLLASATGDVIISKLAGWNGGYGKYVVISHPNGTQTLYGHMQGIIVSSGAHVVQGQAIGYLGTSGNSTGCHVHFEIRGARNPF
ncbi:M23 family metallopeptidase [Candidatus Giovannonibacteria bacterium]|nr:M23 family metallopeptidase [Candidatus Giovannonibacteria bacterium]